MDNKEKCGQIYELSTNTTSRMIYVFAKDRTCPLPAAALPRSDSSALTYDSNILRILSKALNLNYFPYRKL